MLTFISGDGVCSSTTAKTTSSAMPPAMHAQMPGLLQPQFDDCWKPKTLRATPAAIRKTPAVVQARRAVLGHRLRDRDQDERDQRDRDVHPEDRAPRPLGQEAAEDRTDRGQAAGDAEEERQRPAALAQREGLDDDRQRRGEHDRATDALNRPENHDPRLGEAALRRQPAQRRGGGEDDHAEHDHPLMAHRVGEAARRRRRARRARAGRR